jgi:hypothetical protein
VKNQAFHSAGFIQVRRITPMDVAFGKVCLLPAVPGTNVCRSENRVKRALYQILAQSRKSLAKRRHRHALPRLEALLSEDKDVVRYSAAAAILALIA